MTEHAHELLQEKSFLKTLSLSDWLYAAAIAAIAMLVQIKVPHRMDGYETAILWAAAAAAAGLGWFFKPLRLFTVGGVAAGYLAVGLYCQRQRNAGQVSAALPFGQPACRAVDVRTDRARVCRLFRRHAAGMAQRDKAA